MYSFLHFQQKKRNQLNIKKFKMNYKKQLLLSISFISFFLNLFSQNELNIEVEINSYSDTTRIDIYQIFWFKGQLNDDLAAKKDFDTNQLTVWLFKGEVVKNYISIYGNDLEHNLETNIIKKMNFELYHLNRRKFQLVLFGENVHINQFAFFLSGEFKNKRKGKYDGFIPNGPNFIIWQNFNELSYFDNEGDKEFSITTENRKNCKLPYIPPFFKKW